MPTQPIHGATIHYDEKGSGPLLVLLHAFPVDSRMWAEQLADLSSRYRVIAPDFRGFGKSTGGVEECAKGDLYPSRDKRSAGPELPQDRAKHGAGPFTIPSLADDIREFVLTVARASGRGPETVSTGKLPALLERFMLGGLSMGGYVAMNYARKYPDDLRGLILTDTKDAADNSEQRENRNRMIEVVRAKGSTAIAEMMIGKMLAPDTEARRPAIAKTLRAMMEACQAQTIEHALVALRDRPDMTDELPKISIPTLILVGDADAITPPDIAQGMQKKIRGSQLAVIPGAGHMSAMEQPTQVSRAIGKFMDGLRP